MCGKAKAPDYGPLAEANRYAADVMAAAHDRATRAWEAHQAQVREDFRPWREVGLDALAEIASGMESGRFEEKFEGVDEWSKNWKEDPGYQFRIREGLKSIRRANAAGSGAASGAANKAYMRYSQDLASEEFSRARGRAVQDYSIRQAARDRDYNRLAGQSGTGMMATTQIANTGTTATGAIASHIVGGADAIGSGAIGAANAGIQQQYARNAASQQNWNNMLGVGGLVVGGLTGL